MKAYIRGLGAITPQNTFSGNGFPEILVESNTNRLNCIEPSYQQYLNPIMARRMSRVLKMGIAAAMICLKDARLERPDVIVAGTGLGCLGDTEKFLKAIIADDEQFLTPTSFIQSIQNSISAQIALQVNCTGHNFTFVHRGFSFESALLDALMQLKEDEAENVLVGGIDETTDHNYFFYDKLDLWKKEPVNSAKLYDSTTPGTVGGEGAVFFVLSKAKSDADYAELRGVKTIYKPANSEVIQKEIQAFLAERNLEKNDIDLVMYGLSGDARTDHWYTSVKDAYLSNIPACAFKHLCGDYPTAGSFAMWLAATILKSGVVPAAVLYKSEMPGTVKNILIYNNIGDDHTFQLISGV